LVGGVICDAARLLFKYSLADLVGFDDRCPIANGAPRDTDNVMAVRANVALAMGRGMMYMRILGSRFETRGSVGFRDDGQHG
jgi:hypothetical protein